MKSNEYGSITNNTKCGIFGKANEKLLKECDFEAIQIGLKQEVKKGKAYVRCMFGEKVVDYEIEIVKVDYANNNFLHYFL